MPTIEPYRDQRLPERFLRWIEALRLKFRTIPNFTQSDGSPEGVITGTLGDRYYNRTGSGDTVLWVKTTLTGNTGWQTYKELNNILDQRIMSGMGEFESGNVDASGQDVCRHEDVGGPVRLPTPAPAGEQMTIISSSASDGVAGTGVITLRLEYLDAAGAEQIEDIVMNGLTGVNTVATDIRFVNDMYALTVGSAGVAAGNITCYQQGGSIALNLYQFIYAGGNKSLVPHRMVPAGMTLYLQGWHAEEAQSRRCIFRLRSTDMNGVLIPGVFCFKGHAFLNGTTSGEISALATIPALSIVKVSYWATAIGAEGSAYWWGILVDN